ncbi:PVC-type heme-binding CxxCH protein [Prosthecobacter sp.]|uniref:PVC-type heme-binding CxxCH protein n=1 Tax=Prosthecobacter sp. TaxID=1965333 RepID=UPI002ABC058C|nr:PVC-type heme-binding CxxCH protein [Prosthecobacter sp.]MDZ4404681.1 PVC-type heme-binding CxxCH protein [Prosthecobacter sp.]
MKAILLALLAAVSAHAALTGPIRVLYLDAEGKAQTAVGPLHEAMRDLGRDAIWFDYAKEALPAENYDLVVKPGNDLSRDAILSKLSAERKASYEAFLKQRDPEERKKHPQVANYEKRPEPLTLQLPMSVKASMERTQVPADCELKLFASEPDIAKPIAFAWDERGRCWVVETRDYPHGIKENGEGQDSVKICEDTDGDGKADKFTVFADKLNLPTGIVFARKGIIVAAPPKFIYLEDTNGDDKADKRETIIDCWGIRDTHAQASNLHYGFDNWIYGCVGYSGIEGYVGGKKHQFTMGTYRFKPDGSAIEFLHQFTNNAWAHSYNDAGDQFGGTANGAPIFFGGIPATAYPEGSRGMTAKKINVVDTCHTITPNFRQVDVFGGYTAAAGSNFIYSDNLPKRFQGKAMICEPTMKVVSLVDVQPDGAGYKALDFMNLYASSDEWNSPVHAEVGPDGAVWVADFQNFIIQHNPTPSLERGGFVATTGVGGAHENDLRDHSRGRIYRIVGRGLQSRGYETQWSKLETQRTMIQKHQGVAEVADSLRNSFKGGLVSGMGHIHELWTLHGLGKLDAKTHQAALISKDAKLRRNAIRALGSDKAAQDLFFGSGVFSDQDLHTRLAAFVKLAEFSTTPEIQTLVKKLAADPVVKNDEWLTEAMKLLGKKHKALNYQEGPNLIANAGFEQLTDKKLPVGWKHRDYGKQPGNAGAEWTIVSGEGKSHSGQNAFRVITRDQADTSFFADVPLKPNTEYKLSAWIKTHGFRGKASLNDHLGRAETKTIGRTQDWTEVEVTFNSKTRNKASINLLHVGKGDTYFDDVSLVELIAEVEDDESKLAGDVKRGEKIFWEHPVAACKNCHILKGQGSAVGPALDGIATRKDAAYILESLVNPNAKLAEGYVATPISPMPPMNLILKPQEFADVKAFILSLK